jgi:hypothetical protein
MTGGAGRSYLPKPLVSNELPKTSSETGQGS